MKDQPEEGKYGEKTAVADNGAKSEGDVVRTKRSVTQTEVAEKKKTEYKHKPMLKRFKKESPAKNIGLFLGALLVVMAGIGSGWFLSRSSAKQDTSESASEVIEEDNGATAGIPIQNGEEKFDEAGGILESGGIDGEGTHHLVREGGPTKYVYLTSTTLDLESFVGKTVLVKGETMTAQSAPWLMDVWVIKELK
jgi:hypothetical protein